MEGSAASLSFEWSEPEVRRGGGGRLRGAILCLLFDLKSFLWRTMVRTVMAGDVGGRENDNELCVQGETVSLWRGCI